MSEFYEDDYFEDDFDDEDEFYEDDDEVDATFILEAIRGHHGPELQAQVAEMAGIELEEDHDEYEDDEDAAWTQEFIAQQQRLENEIGRELTGKEIEALAEDHYLAETPNLQESWKRIGRDMTDDHSRQEVMAEMMEEESDLQDAQDRLEADGPDADSPAVESMVGAMERDE